MELKFRTLRADEIDCRVAQCTLTDYRQGVQLLLYKDARVDMDILDETVGAMNWQRSHQEIKGNLYCNISIYDKDKNEWVTKQDCGVESNTEKEKGEASDASKRSCFNWGIGRELYTSPTIFVEWEIEKKTNNGREILKPKYSPAFYVSDIDYDDKRNISLLVIRAKSGKSDKEVFNWKKGDTKPTNAPTTPDSNKPKNIPPKEEKSVTTQNTQSNDISLEQAKKVSFANGRNANVPFEKLNDNDLKWIAQNSKGKYQQAAAVILMARQEQQSFLTELKEMDETAPF